LNALLLEFHVKEIAMTATVTRPTLTPADKICQRVAKEVQAGMLVNLGIGMPTGVANFLPSNVKVFFQSENGIVGMGTRPPEGLEDEDLTDAGGAFTSAIPGAATIDSAMSFALIRGGHLDMTVLGGLQVDSKGRLANWMVPGKMVPGMGGAMDLVSGAKQVIIAMQHTAKGAPKIVPECTLPLTALRPVSLIVTEMAVIKPTEDGLLLLEVMEGYTVDDVIAATSAELIIRPELMSTAA
jgi:acetate CoA/acetoacetate CoA-transferase beta subunit